MKRINHTKVKKQFLKDPEVLKHYNELEEEFYLINELLRARKKAGKTQEEVAKLMHTTKSAVSRLESLSSKATHSPSFATLKKYAHALGCHLTIKLEPIQEG
jgi:transcriptional regulator with XRE-family HTH domain